ncbi:MAG TPA: serine/threonine-protein kinase [Gemmatimonadales bacterium]|nr:serine/threonine-protein kinase [Gemmatimonadales bacterium]
MSDTLQRLTAALGERYALEREIGAGGMATVYLARDLRHGRPVAIKVVRPELSGPPGIARFLREIELAARLQHPHILPVFDSGTIDDGAGGQTPYFVMPYVEGETLRARLARETQLPVEDAISLATEVADALAYAHAAGVVHRDIKPENILLSGGHAMVADFGVAKALATGQRPGDAEPRGDRTTLTQIGLAIGTPNYMAPEQATGRDRVDAKADQYSLGCVLYEMLSGSPPFAGGSAQSVLARNMTAPRPHVGRIRSDVPDALEDVIIRAMAIDPADRYPDMVALATALRQTRSAARPRRKTVMAVVVAAAIAAGAAGAVAWIATHPDKLAVTEEAETIAVLPFSASGQGVEVLGEGMVDLLTTNLQGVGGIAAVDPRLVLKQWGERGGGEPESLKEALALGRELDAGSVVTGSAVSAGGRVRLAADLYAVTGGERLGRAQVDGPVDSILPLVDRLSVALLRDVWRSREPLPSLDLGSLTTDSIAALRAYLQGEHYYRRFALDSALAHFTRAVEVDSTFALAHLRRALIFGWTGGYGSPASVQAAEAGYRFADRLPPRSRRLLDGYRRFEEGSPTAIDSMRAYVADYPEDLEGWYTYAEALHHLQPIEPRSPDSIIAAFDSVIAGDSALTPAVVHPLEISMIYRDSVRFQRYLQIFSRTATPRRVEAHRVGGALIWGPAPEESAVRAALAAVPHIGFYAFLSSYRDEAATSDTILDRRARLLAALPAGSPVPQHEALERGYMLVGFGRLREARDLVDTVAVRSPGAAAGLLGWPVALGLAPPSYGGTRADSLMAVEMEDLASPQRLAYVDAVKAIAQGQPEEAVKRATEGMRAPDGTSDSTINRGMLKAALGWAHLVQGDTADGVAEMRDGLSVTAGAGRGEVSFLRLQLALTLAAQDRTRAEGITRLRHGFNDNAVFLMPLAYLALGRTYEAAGKADSAAMAYGRFLHLWDKADPELQGRVTEAREALARLTAEPR